MSFNTSAIIILTSSPLIFGAKAMWLSPLLSVISSFILVMTIFWSLIQTFNHNPPANFLRIWGQLFLFYLARTMPWWGLVITVMLVTSLLPLLLGIILLVAVCIYFYSVCIVPFQLKVKAVEDLPPFTNLKKPAKVAVISNVRLGLFSHPRQLINLVNTVNELEVNAVFFIGEWLYNPPADLVGSLMQLKVINKPVYAIQGAYDNRYHPDNADQFLHEDDLTHAFTALGITEVKGSTTSNFLVPILAPSTKSNISTKALRLNEPSIILANTKQVLTQYITLTQSSCDDIPSGKSQETSFSAVILMPIDSNIFSTKNSLDLPNNVLIKKMPSFGQRGLPFLLSKPSITVLHLNLK